MRHFSPSAQHGAKPWIAADSIEVWRSDVLAGTVVAVEGYDVSPDTFPVLVLA